MTSEDQIQNQTIDYVKQSQDVALKVVTSISEIWAHALRAVVPGTSDVLPAPDEFIDKSFDFGIQVLDMQRAFAHNLVRAAVPAVRAAEQVAERATSPRVTTAARK